MKTILKKITLPNNCSVTFMGAEDMTLADDFTVETVPGLGANIDTHLDLEPDEPDMPESELPSWDEAPEWAQWRAVNKDGDFFWLEAKPPEHDTLKGSIDFPSIWGTDRGRYERVKNRTFLYPGSLQPEKRPKPDLPELPSWDEAPEWAQWRVVNAQGALIYFKNKPLSVSGSGSDLIRSTTGKYHFSLVNFPDPKDWQATIERRPFEPPWDKIASPYDEYGLSAFGSHAYFYVEAFHSPAALDQWTSRVNYSRIRREHVYRRPGSE